MSVEYNEYLRNHKEKVAAAFYWIEKHLPELLLGDYNYETQICVMHDASKTLNEEYDAYDRYFYGGNKSDLVQAEFDKAWLNHIHANKHHWQHWVLYRDEEAEGVKTIEMEYNYIIEMICDWWSFSFVDGYLDSIFNWYNMHKDHISFGPETRKTVEYILMRINNKLGELHYPGDYVS